VDALAETAEPAWKTRDGTGFLNGLKIRNTTAEQASGGESPPVTSRAPAGATAAPAIFIIKVNLLLKI